VTSYQEEPDGEAAGWSPVTVAVIAIMVLLLGFGGALFGIYAAHRPTPGAVGPTTTPSATPSAEPTTSPTPEVTPSGSESSTSSRIAVPDVVGKDFQLARSTIRNARLGWRLIFEGSQGDLTVRATVPAPATLVTEGTTIKIYVRGPAPLAVVPDVVGQTCSLGTDQIINNGLYPRYRTGRTGTIQKQSPLATDPQTLHWNDIVDIWCAS
jgi:PASTA domain-containing protein